eukprot:CCRYP_006287-RA/>CCRYP_006287-RA protein AED:0.39 eAED:0.39 QI:0/-1/0/1/-1/1/1/0/252
MAGNAPTNAELAEQIAALTAVVANLANAITGNQAPPAAAAPPVATVAFATSLAAAVEELIIYTTKHGANMYEQGTKALGTPFSMKASQVVILKRTTRQGKHDGLGQRPQNILKFTNKDSRQISLIAEYGQIDAETLKAACQTFITGINSDKRAAQNNKQMWRCLYNSLKEAKATLLTYRQDYELMVNGTARCTTHVQDHHEACHPRRQGNCYRTRANLRELTLYAIKENGNIDKIHTYFNHNYAQLKAAPIC